MKTAKRLQGAGGALVGLGMAFLVLAMNGQGAFIGVGMAVLAMGIACLANPRKAC